MTLLYRDPVFQEHDTGNHPEHARRLVAIEKRLAESDLLEQCRQPACPVVDVNHLTAVHTPEHIATVESYAQEGGGRIEVDTVVSRNSYDAAARAAGTVCDAVNCVVAGEASNAMCLVRPPGHHALRDAPMGFCLFNNIAVGARLAIDHLGLNRVLVIDWDVHHGNGTQASFWTDPQIAFFSIHRFPFYPGTGDADETGSGDGLGTTLNLPVSFGTPVRE